MAGAGELQAKLCRLQAENRKLHAQLVKERQASLMARKMHNATVQRLERQAKHAEALALASRDLEAGVASWELRKLERELYQLQGNLADAAREKLEMRERIVELKEVHEQLSYRHQETLAERDELKDMLEHLRPEMLHELHKADLEEHVGDHFFCENPLFHPKEQEILEREEYRKYGASIPWGPLFTHTLFHEDKREGEDLEQTMKMLPKIKTAVGCM